MNTPLAGSLAAMLSSIPDPRGRKGRRHPAVAMLAATICGILTGATGCEAISQWVRNQPPKVWHLLGFGRKPPCANSYRTLLARLPAEQLEQAIARWISSLLGEPVDGQSLQGVALDGKTLCNTLQPHGQSIHLLSLLDHQTGSVLQQLRMPGETNEHKTALRLLERIVLKGRVITGDAIFCQRDLCRQVVNSGGDYLLSVKDNQPELKAAIQAEFQPGLSPL